MISSVISSVIRWGLVQIPGEGGGVDPLKLRLWDLLNTGGALIDAGLGKH